MLEWRGAGDERESPLGLTVLSVLDLFIPLLDCFVWLNLDDLVEVSCSFFAALDLEDTVTLEGLLVTACDFKVVFKVDLETFDLEVLVLCVLELLRLSRCFLSDSVVLHLLVFDLECVELSGLAEGGMGRGRGPAGSEPNTPHRVEGPADWCPLLTMDTRWWEPSLFIEDRKSPKLVILELLSVELDTCELVLKLEKDLEVELAMLEVITWVVRLPPPPPEELHPPTRLLLSILI